MRISDWSSDVCSSDLIGVGVETAQIVRRIDEFLRRDLIQETTVLGSTEVRADYLNRMQAMFGSLGNNNALGNSISDLASAIENVAKSPEVAAHRFDAVNDAVEMAQYFNDMGTQVQQRSEEHTSELQSLMRSTSAVLRLQNTNDT